MYREFIGALQDELAYFSEKLAKVPVVPAANSGQGRGLVFKQTLAVEIEHDRTCLTLIIGVLAEAISQIENDVELQTLLEQLHEIRTRLTAEETAYYNVLSSAANSFQTAFVYTCDLRSMCTKADLCCMQITSQMQTLLAKLAASQLAPLFRLFKRTPLSASLLLADMSVPQRVSIPSVSHIVRDLTERCKFSPTYLHSFGQATRAYTPPSRPSSSSTDDPSALAFPGIVAPGKLCAQDSVSLQKGEVLHILASAHGYLLVRRCADDNPDSYCGLIPSNIVNPYREPHCQSPPHSPATQPTARNNRPLRVTSN